MSLTIGTQIENYFSVKSGQHKPFCPYDESKNIQIIKHLDRTGTSTTIEDLYCQFGNQCKESARNRKQTHAGAGERTRISEEENQNKASKKLVLGKRQPRNLIELYSLLASLGIHDTYTKNRTVGDLLIDHRNIAAYRGHGLQSGQMAIILCSKTTYDKDRSEIRREKSSVLLTDGFAFHDRVSPLYFIINTTRAGRDKIFHANKGKIFAVFGIWRPLPEHASVYVCDHIPETLIETLDNNLIND